MKNVLRIFKQLVDSGLVMIHLLFALSRQQLRVSKSFVAFIVNWPDLEYLMPIIIGHTLEPYAGGWVKGKWVGSLGPFFLLSMLMTSSLHSLFPYDLLLTWPLSRLFFWHLFKLSSVNYSPKSAQAFAPVSEGDGVVQK